MLMISNGAQSHRINAARSVVRFLVRHRSSAAKVRPQWRHPSHRHYRRTESTRIQRRCYASSAPNEVKNVAILGGGITGLSTAHFITEEFPQAEVTIYESQSRLGGWLRSSEIDVGDGKVIFEEGPRSLRLHGANGRLMLRLIESLGLTDDVLVTPRTSPAAQNRFIYYPNGLVRLPGAGRPFDNFRSLFFEPAFAGLIPAVAKDAGTDKRPRSLTDESVGDFITRRGDKRIADNLVSAVYHGIYAGDIWQLSARSLLPLQWEQEARYENLVTAMWESLVKKEGWQFADDLECQMALQEQELSEKLQRKAVGASVITLKKGLGQLSKTLAGRLRSNERVHFRMNEAVSGVRPVEGGLEVSTASSQPAEAPARFSHVVSTLAPHNLTNVLPEPFRKSFPFTASNPMPAVGVAVVNLYYRTPHLLTKLRPPNTQLRHLRPNGLQGFGYLIPASVPFTTNPERALGVVFDSDVTPDLHSSVPPEKQGTRLTVMLGGHWWDGWSDLPTKDDCIEMARSVLQNHLGLEEQPVAAKANVQRSCIPQYKVGHSDRLRRMHQALASSEAPSSSTGEPPLAPLASKIRVAGSHFTGVGVNDCVRSAFDVVQGLKRDAQGKGLGPHTGLDRFRDESRPMALVRREANGVVMVLKLDERARGGRFPRVEGLIKGKTKK